MISEKSIDQYSKQFPDDYCGHMEPSDTVIIEDADGNCYEQPKNETDESFIDRLLRSKTAGKNLFYTEWEPYDEDFDDVEM